MDECGRIKYREENLDGTTLAAVLVATRPHQQPQHLFLRSPPSHPTTGEGGDSFLAAASPDPDRLTSARRGARAVSTGTAAFRLWGRIWC